MVNKLHELHNLDPYAWIQEIRYNNVANLATVLLAINAFRRDLSLLYREDKVNVVPAPLVNFDATLVDLHMVI